MAWNLWKRVGVALVLMSAALFLWGCDIFRADGTDEVGIHARGGYFYIIDNDSQRLVMLDRNLTECRSWPFSDFTTETYVQGLCFDGASLWVSVSGGDDALHQLDLAAGSAISVVRSLEAPPSGQGAVRDIAWDGEFFWALNSGSTTYGNPPELFNLDPVDGTVLAQYPLPSAEPRGMCFVGPNANVYGSGARQGCYYTDKDDDAVYVFELERRIFHDAFPAPVGPRGENYVYPLGIFFDGQTFWSTNSSGPADYLFQLAYDGSVEQRHDPPYEQMGALAWTEADLTVPAAPVVRQVSPNTAGPGAHKMVSATGSGFRTGLTADFGVGVVVDSLSLVNSSEVSIYLTVDADADIGPRDVTLTNPDGKQGIGAGLFVIVEVDPSTGYLWLAENDGNRLYRYSINDGTFVASYATAPVAPGGSLQGLVFAAGDLWLAAAGTDDYLVKVDTTGGVLTALQFIDGPPDGTGVVRDMAFDGTDLWVPNDGTMEIYRMNIDTGEILENIPTPGAGARGVAWAEGQLYCNDKDTDQVYVWDTGTSTWSVAFEVPPPPSGTTANRYPTGLTWDGVGFWMCNSTGDHDYIIQTDIAGTVLKTVEVPNRGGAQPTGLAFSQN